MVRHGVALSWSTKVVRKQYTPGCAAALPGTMRLTQVRADALALGVGGHVDVVVLRGTRKALLGAAQALHDGGRVPRGLARPACNLVNAASRPLALGLSMARSFSSRAGEWQYSSTSPCAPGTRWSLIVTSPADCTSVARRASNWRSRSLETTR